MAELEVEKCSWSGMWPYVVSYQNECFIQMRAAFLLSSFLHNIISYESREHGSKKSSSHFDETLSFRKDTTVFFGG